MSSFSIFNKSSLDPEIKRYLYEQYPRFVQSGKKRNEWKNYLVTIHVTQTGCKNCKELAKHVYVDDVFASGTRSAKYRLLSDAIAKGVLLDSCHTSILTYFEGITKNPRLRK